MATASKKSKDYDPIEEALDLGYSVGRSEERNKRTEHVNRARRGGARHGGAAAKQAAEEDRKRRAKKQREANARMRASRALREEEDKARARRGAYRSGQAAQKRATADAARQSRMLSSAGGRSRSSGSRSSASLRAPRTTTGTPTLPTGTGIDKVTSSRIILMSVAIGAIGVVAHDAIIGAAPTKQAITTKGGVEVKVPAHLRSLGGVFIMGTVAMIVNEIDPGVGLLLGFGILFGVGVKTLTGKDGVLGAVGAGLFNGTHPAKSSDGGGIFGVGGALGPERGRKPGSIGPPLGDSSPPPILGKDPVTGKPVPSA